MATMEDARVLAERYAVADSLRTGQAWRGYVEEFRHGWLIWTTPPPDVRPDIGTGNKAVLDRETDEVSYWPALPTDQVAAMYAHGRPDGRPEGTIIADPTLLGRLLPGPNAVTLLLSGGRTHHEPGAKGDAAPVHHPLIERWLAEQPTGHLVRGVRRHGELIALTNQLALHDRRAQEQGEQPLDLHGARTLLRGCRGVVHKVRSSADPEHGQQTRPCDSCLSAWVHFGLTDDTALAFVEPYRPPLSTTAPDPARFPPQVASVLVDAGWGNARTLSNGQPFDPQRWAQLSIELISEQPGGRYRIPPLEAARAAIARYPIIISQLRGPGRDCWVRPFTLAVGERLAHYCDALGDLAQTIGAPLFPLGEEEEGGGLIAIDENGRIFVLDQAGAWCYGTNIDSALTNLLEGVRPARVRSDGVFTYGD